MPSVGVWEPFEAGTVASKLVEVIRGDPRTWLPPPGDDRGPGHWAVTVQAGPIERLATCMVGEAEGDENSVRRHIRWQVDPEPVEGSVEHVRSLPSFEGELVLRSRAGEYPEIRLEGEYERPTGPVGLALGPGQMQGLAEAATERFLAEIVQRLHLESSAVRNDDDRDAS